MNTAVAKVQRSLGSGLSGDGSGVIGQIAAVIGGTSTSGAYTLGTFSVTDRRQLVHLEVGDICGSWTARKNGTARTGRFEVVSVSVNAGRITYRTADGWAPQANDHIAVDGDYGKKLLGLQAWFPDAEPTAGDNFGGVDRSVNPTRLAGVRVDCAALGISSHEDAFTVGMEEFGLHGVNVTHCFTSFYDYGQLEAALGNRKVIQSVENDYNLKIDGIKVGGGLVIPDRNIPKGRAYPLNLDVLDLLSIGEAPHIVRNDKLDMMRVADADAFEARVRAWPQLRCEDPSQGGVVLLPA